MTYDLSGITVLVVEDNQAMLDLTRSLLLTFGVGHVIGAKNGEVGYQMLKRYQPDIVIADWMMSPVDGISFTRMIRNSPDSNNPYVPIILMTGFSERRRVLQARDSGVTEFVVKPFNAKDLYKRIVQIIERPRQFVRAPDFFGPDRRRKVSTAYEGPKRREDDAQRRMPPENYVENQKQAHEMLQQIRLRAGLDKGDKFDLKGGTE